MSKTRLVTIICTCISAITLTGLVIWFLVAQPWGGSFGFNFLMGTTENLTGAFRPVESQTIDADGINSIFIDWTAGEVRLTPHYGNEISVTEFAQRELNENELMYITVSDGELHISFTRRTVMRMPPKQLEVLIPADLSLNLHSLDVETVSGRVVMSDISASNMRVRSVSGALDISNAAAQSLRASSVSGRISLSDVTGDGVNLSSTSGSLELRNVNAGLLDTGSVSGTQELSGAFVRVDSTGTSGRVSIQSSIVPEFLNISTISGRVEITVPNDGNRISVSHSSVSGRFSSELPVLMHGTDAQFRISTTSGNINIYELR